MKNLEKTEVIDSSKDTKKKMISAVIAGALVLSGGVYYIQKTISENRVKAELNGKELVNDFTLNGNNCYERSNYFVITRKDLSENEGNDVLVKYKTDKFEKIDCDYLAKEGDFELLNTPSSDAPSVYNSQNYLDIKDNLIVVDSGVGINRTFKIYDLETKESIFSDGYTSGLFDIENDTLSYWRKTNDIPNKDNCSRVDEYNSMGGAKIEGKVVLDLTDTSKKEFSEFRCSSV